ncbi:MAG: dNTP triphosphohydrolase [Acidobacteria bacterium]|nr:dNTP triphosphohydrolase [Acidobacteriota bacterium]
MITAAAFRRLQTKAQVFSLERNAAVRSRLTHTLEVALYGQLIARRAADLLVGSAKLDPADVFSFITTTETACLLHDCGNPPFGHLGEFAIQEWFTKRAFSLRRIWKQAGLEDSDIERFLSAYRAFDGNPQAFRIVTCLQWFKDPYGLNLSFGLLGAILKYPTGVRDENKPFSKKIGFFPTEREIVETVWEKTGMTPGQRHPLAFLMEAADDIAYCVSDIEDALEKGIVNLDDFRSKSPETAKVHWPEAILSPKCANAEFFDFRISWTYSAVELAAQTFANRYDEILSGQMNEPLLEADETMKSIVKGLKNFAIDRVFASKEAIHVELSGYRVVQELLKRLSPLLRLSTKDFAGVLPASPSRPKGFALERRLASLLPTKHLLFYRHVVAIDSDNEPLHRMQLLVDYVSGMTDVHALQVFRTLTAGADGV